MPSLIPLQDSIVYGPVRSRRLGRSLGLNLFPADRKVCTFECIYCHFGSAKYEVRSTNSELQIPSVDSVLAAVEEYLRSEYDFDVITLSGNGEPTLYPGFVELIPRLKALIGRFRPAVKLVLLSNSTTVNDPAIRSAICRIDVPLLKLDAGDQATFDALNRPCSVASGQSLAAGHGSSVTGHQATAARHPTALDDIVEGLASLARECPITIQTVMLDGPVSNCKGEPFDNWVRAIRRIRPVRVQLYTTDRPVADVGIRKLTADELESVAARAREMTGVDCRAY